MMPAAQPLSPVAATPKPANPTLVAVPSDAYVHVIESGESLYTIARRYNVTAQAIVQANGFSSPDKIFVGQKIVIPGRADLLARMGPTKVADTAPDCRSQSYAGAEARGDGGPRHQGPDSRSQPPSRLPRLRRKSRPRPSPWRSRWSSRNPSRCCLAPTSSAGRSRVA